MIARRAIPWRYALILILVACLASQAQRQGAGDAWDLPERAKQVVERQSGFRDDAGATTWDRQDEIDRGGWDDADGAEEDAVKSSESSTIAKMLDTWDRQDEIDRGGWDDADGAEEDAVKSPESSTIAKMLDDRLKEEFKDEGVDGKQYNETVLMDESKQETVCLGTHTTERVSV